METVGGPSIRNPLFFPIVMIVIIINIVAIFDYKL